MDERMRNAKGMAPKARTRRASRVLLFCAGTKKGDSGQKSVVSGMDMCCLLYRLLVSGYLFYVARTWTRTGSSSGSA